MFRSRPRNEGLGSRPVGFGVQGVQAFAGFVLRSPGAVYRFFCHSPGLCSRDLQAVAAFLGFRVGVLAWVFF